MNTQIQHLAAKGPDASRLRQRKYALVRAHSIPEDLAGGSLAQTHRRCGKSNCHCANGRGHAMWSVTFSHRGKRRVERVPKAWLAELEQAVVRTQAYLDAIKEVMAINVELLAQARTQELARQRKRRTRRVKNRQVGPKNDQHLAPTTDPKNM